MSKIKGEHWKTSDKTVRLQIATNKQQQQLQEALPGWECISFGYIPKTNQDIYVFERHFETELDWTNFLSSDKTKSLIDMKEIKND
jgi:hypothetical protein